MAQEVLRKKHESLSEECISAILRMMFEAQVADAKESKDLIQKVMAEHAGMPQQDNGVDQGMYQLGADRALYYMAGAMAKRLKENRRDRPLVSVADREIAVSQAVADTQEKSEKLIEGVELLVLTSLLSSLADNLLDLMKTITELLNQDPYDYYWSIVHAVQDIAQEDQVLFDDAVKNPANLHRIYRMIYTKEQYVDFSKKSLQASLDVELFIEIAVDSLIKMSKSMEYTPTKAEKEQIRELVKTPITAQLAPAFELLKEQLPVLIDEKANHIWS